MMFHNKLSQNSVAFKIIICQCLYICVLPGDQLIQTGLRRAQLQDTSWAQICSVCSLLSLDNQASQLTEKISTTFLTVMIEALAYLHSLLEFRPATLLWPKQVRYQTL